MSRAGYVRIDLCCDPHRGAVRTADVVLRRPTVAPLLTGRTPEEAIELVGVLHAVCGAAHRLAAHRAVQAARSRHPTPPDPAALACDALERKALAEIALDHLCRLYIDWPGAIGLPVQPHQALLWRRRLGAGSGALDGAQIAAVRHHGLGLLAAVPAIAGIRQRLRRRVRKTVACLTAINLEAGHPGKIRKLVTPSAPAVGAPQRAGDSIGDSGWHGEGRTFTARGELIHRVALARDASGRETVAAWAIDAPTDRLFVPAGPVARALMDLEGSGASLQRLARLVVLSFDPCVESRVEVHEFRPADARDVARTGNP